MSIISYRPNAPVQARWANAQRAGILPPNPPTGACNRLLDGTLTKAIRLNSQRACTARSLPPTRLNTQATVGEGPRAALPSKPWPP